MTKGVVFLFKITLNDRVQAENFVRGVTFFGTGGGGSYQRGIDRLMDRLAKGHTV